VVYGNGVHDKAVGSPKYPKGDVQCHEGRQKKKREPNLHLREGVPEEKKTENGVHLPQLKKVVTYFISNVSDTFVFIFIFA
jgi:hypothetical protein